jgi:hypothetical protein
MTGLQIDYKITLIIETPFHIYQVKLLMTCNSYTPNHFKHSREFQVYNSF